MTDEELQKKVDEILVRMSPEEKIALCSGQDYRHTKAFEKYGIPSIAMTDGPHGLRRETDGPGDQSGQKASAPEPAIRPR